MSISLNLDNFLVKNRYVFSDTKKFGTLYSLQTDYDVYLKCVARMKIAGIQIDKKSKTFYIGKLKSFKTRYITEQVITKTANAYVDGSSGYYDDTLEEVLGGQRQTLGE
jgi:hypothetical protein